MSLVGLLFGTTYILRGFLENKRNAGQTLRRIGNGLGRARGFQFAASGGPSSSTRPVGDVSPFDSVPMGDLLFG